MTADVTSHRRRKRLTWGWAARRFGALAVTLVALGAVSWLAPFIPHRRERAVPIEMAEAPEGYKLPAAIKVTPVFDLPEIRQAATQQRPRRRGVPLDAAVRAPGEDFEVLSAAELDAISQAHN